MEVTVVVTQDGWRVWSQSALQLPRERGALSFATAMWLVHLSGDGLGEPWEAAGGICLPLLPEQLSGAQLNLASEGCADGVLSCLDVPH